MMEASCGSVKRKRRVHGHRQIPSLETEEERKLQRDFRRWILSDFAPCAAKALLSVEVILGAKYTSFDGYSPEIMQFEWSKGCKSRYIDCVNNFC